MKSNHTIEIGFIKNLLIKGFDRKCILQEFTKTYKRCSIKTFDNRLKIAREQIKSDIDIIGKRTEESINNDVEALKLSFLTVAERIDILTKIAKGEIPLTKPIVCDGVINHIPVVPDWMDRRNAIAELNKMCGDYAPAKTDLTTKGESLNKQLDLSKLSDAELRTIAELQSKVGASQA